MQNFLRAAYSKSQLEQRIGPPAEANDYRLLYHARISPQPPRARRTPRHRDLERNEGSTNRLRDLLGEGGEIEVVAPDSDFAGIVQLEPDCDSVPHLARRSGPYRL